MAVSVADITRMSPAAVDQLFVDAKPGEIPRGAAKGVAILRPGAATEALSQRLVHALAWRGKVLYPDTGDLKNLILPLGVRAIAADVYRDESWFDGRSCIVLDYSKRSLLARLVRDEIREVSPGLYLGLVYVGKWRTIYFTLQFESEPGAAN